MNTFTSGITIIRLTVGMLETNCYILFDTNSKDAAIVDPADDAPRILDEAAKIHLTVRYIINTHGHIDHIGANAAVKKATHADLLIHRNDAFMLEDAISNGAILLGLPYTPIAADRLLDDNDIIWIGNTAITVIHTPGHSPGSMSLYFDKTLVSGDLIFRGSVGRWDLIGGDKKQLVASFNGIMKLPEATRIYPGHGPVTSIADEKVINPFRKEIEEDLL